VEWQWWRTGHRVEAASGLVHLRRGPIVHCVEGVDLPDVDLRDLVVAEPTAAPHRAFAVVEPDAELYAPLDDHVAVTRPVEVRTTPYAQWSNRGTTTMRMRFPLA
jgi:hypothetical protein